MTSSISNDLRSGALVFHETGRPGKLEVRATKPLGNQRDLAFSVVYLIDMAKAMVERSLQAPRAAANA